MTEEKKGPPPAGKVEPKEIGVTQYQSEVAAFGKVLKASGIQEDVIPTILDYVSQEDITDLVKLDANLWDMGIASVHQRRRIVKYWARSIGAQVPGELSMKYLELAKRSPAAEDEERKRETEEGRIWFVSRDVKGEPDLRPAKKEERAMTLEEAKDAMEFMAKSEEPIVTFDTATGKHIPNWNSSFVTKNPEAAWMTAQALDKAMAAGEERDPFTTMAGQIAQIEGMKDLIGVKREATAEKTSVSEIIDGMLKLRELEGSRQTGPDWASDPFKFTEVMDKLIESRMPKEDSAAKAEIQRLTDQLDREREERHKSDMERRDAIIAAQNKRMDDLEEQARNPRTTSGLGAIDLMAQMVQKFPDRSDFRTGLEQVMRTVRETQRFSPTTPEMRAEGLEKMEHTLSKDTELTKMENWLFFGVE